MRRYESRIDTGSGRRDYLVCRDAVGLVSLAQMGVLEIHPWGSRADNVERPDRLIFDLDPDPAVDWPQVIEAAVDLRELLDGVLREALHGSRPASADPAAPEIRNSRSPVSRVEPGEPNGTPAAGDGPERKWMHAGCIQFPKIYVPCMHIFDFYPGPPARGPPVP